MVRYHDVWKLQKKSHSILRAKRATFTFWVDKSWLKMPEMVHLASFWKPEAFGQTVLPLPDMSLLLIGQKLAETANIQKFKCDILSNVQTMRWTLNLFSDSSKSFSFWMMAATMCFPTLLCLTVFIICNAFGGNDVRVLSPWLPTRSRLLLTFMRKRTISFNSIDLHCNSVYWCPFPVAHWIEEIALNFVLFRICWQADIS